MLSPVWNWTLEFRRVSARLGVDPGREVASGSRKRRHRRCRMGDQGQDREDGLGMAHGGLGGQQGQSNERGITLSVRL